jgi:predicted transcriptional regulator of viral defense system
MSYISTSQPLPKGRTELEKVVRAGGDIIDVESAAAALAISHTAAAKRLARWVKQGWLRRVAQGRYAAASLTSLTSERVLDDPWVLVPVLYDPGYIGGRTAAEYWDLTEQIFKDIIVLTARTIRSRSQQHHGAIFTVKHILEDKIFGTAPVWRHQTKVSVSDIHRTVIDMLADPALGGGIQHVADCLRAYLAHKNRNDKKLVEYADRLGNGAVFKRLGFLVEREPDTKELIDACHARLTQGNARIDPLLAEDHLVTRWRLWVPRNMSDR